MKRGLAAWLAVTLWGTAGVAQTNEVRVRLPSCATAPFDYEEFTEVLRVELAPDPVVVGTAESTVDVDMPCEGASHVQIRVRGAAVRRMDIGDLPTGARPRGIAVVAAELVRSARSGHDAPAPPPKPEEPPPPPPPSPPSPAPAKVDAPPTRTRTITWDVRAAAEGRVFLVAPTALFGASLGGRFHRVRGGIALLRGSAGDALGRTDLTLVYGSLGFEVWRLSAGRFEFVLAPRASAGVIAADATANARATGRSSREPYLDAALGFEARVRIGDVAWATFDADAGYARGLIATADQRVVARPDGLFVGLRAGIAIAP
ncbi:hypothetical protein LVJ94_52635 [Pendulispora rubella]|uniref:Uncharacterized protein n=1 Tax=Pendulispora rubella TaxID=2741070 RepID=A0ABZ2L9Y2_9BACT